MKVNLSEKQTDILFKVIVIAAIYFVLAKPVFNFLGITKSRGDRLKKKVESNPDSPFHTTFWQKFNPSKYSPNGSKITTARKKELLSYAKKIRHAMGFWVDTEPDIVYAFHSCKTQVEVSIMSYLFNQEYKKDLFSFLVEGLGYMPQNGLSDYDMQVLIDYVNSLPVK